MHVAGDAQTLGAALNHASLNVANALAAAALARALGSATGGRLAVPPGIEREADRGHRARLQAHLLRLSERDRYLRFGTIGSDRSPV